MAKGPRRPLFYIGVLSVGFVLGGFLSTFLREFLPQSAARGFFTYAVTPSFGPVALNLLVMQITLGPIVLHVTILSVVGVAVAYFVARSLF